MYPHHRTALFCLSRFAAQISPRSSLTSSRSQDRDVWNNLSLRQSPMQSYAGKDIEARACRRYAYDTEDDSDCSSPAIGAFEMRKKATRATSSNAGMGLVLPWRLCPELDHLCTCSLISDPCPYSRVILRGSRDQNRMSKIEINEYP